MQEITAAERRVALRAATVTTGLRLLPGHGAALARHLTLLADSPAPPPPPVWTDADAREVSVRLAARARCDVLSDGSDLVDRYFDDARLRTATLLSAAARSHLFSSAAEYSCAIGLPGRAARFAGEAVLFAETEAVKYRALSASALGLALNGEYLAAEDAMAHARALFAANAWSVEDTAYLLLLASTLMASARMDATALGAIANEYDAAHPDDPFWSYAARATGVMRDLLRGDHEAAAVASAELLREGHPGSQRMIRDFLVCIRADVLAAQQRFEQGLDELASAVSPPGHAICFEMQRSACLLQLGRERELLAETAACAGDDDHCLRTLTPLLVRRALAFQRVGESRRAHQSMESALLLIARTGNSLTPFLLLPRDETATLIEGVVRDHPELAPAVPPILVALQRVGAVPAPRAALDDAPRLTRTERALLEALRGSDTLRQIASDRGVSLNTVKTQARAVYRKLGATGRADLVARYGDRFG